MEISGLISRCITQPNVRGIALVACLLFIGSSSFAAESRVVVVFGDSLTAGSALPAAERDQLWVHRVEVASQGRLQMVNEGKGGRPTASLAEFGAMLKRRPKLDCLVIALGANDARDITPECVPKAVANIRAMVEQARRERGDALSIVIVGPTDIRKDALGPSRNIADQREEKLAELVPAFSKLAGELGCTFVNLHGVVAREHLSRDGVHPDGAGNEPIAKVVMPALLTETKVQQTKDKNQ